MEYNVAESGQFLQWGSMGNFFSSCRVRMKFCTRVRLKPSMIEENLSLIGQEVKIISPKIRLHWDMKRTIELICKLEVKDIIIRCDRFEAWFDPF